MKIKHFLLVSLFAVGLMSCDADQPFTQTEINQSETFRTAEGTTDLPTKETIDHESNKMQNNDYDGCTLRWTKPDGSKVHLNSCNNSVHNNSTRVQEGTPCIVIHDSTSSEVVHGTDCPGKETCKTTAYRTKEPEEVSCLCCGVYFMDNVNCPSGCAWQDCGEEM